MKKITRKKALSLALAGLMLAPSMPIQSFAEAANLGTNVENSAGIRQTQPKQFIWGKYQLTKSTSEEVELSGKTNGIPITSGFYNFTNNYGFYSGLSGQGEGRPGIKVEGYQNATALPGGLVKLSGAYQNYVENNSSTNIAGPLYSVASRSEYTLNMDKTWFEPTVSMKGTLIVDASQVKAVKNVNLEVYGPYEDNPHFRITGEAYNTIKAASKTEKGSYIEDVTAPPRYLS